MNTGTKLGFQIGAFWASIFFFAFAIGGNYSSGNADLAWVNVSSVLCASFITVWALVKFLPEGKCEGNIFLAGLIILLVIISIGCGTFVTSFTSDKIGETLREEGPASIFKEFIDHTGSLFKGLDTVKDSAQAQDANMLTSVGKHFHWIIAAIFIVGISLPLICSSIPRWMIKGAIRSFWVVLGITLLFFLAWAIIHAGNFGFYESTMEWKASNPGATKAILLGMLFLIAGGSFFSCRPATSSD